MGNEFFWIARDKEISDKKVEIEFSRSLFNGAFSDLRTIYHNEKDEIPIGFYHPRIS
jgi:hypothetical protein